MNILYPPTFAAWGVHLNVALAFPCQNCGEDLTHRRDYRFCPRCGANRGALSMLGVMAVQPERAMRILKHTILRDIECLSFNGGTPLGEEALAEILRKKYCRPVDVPNPRYAVWREVRRKECEVVPLLPAWCAEGEP